jgi:hypothetical protein
LSETVVNFTLFPFFLQKSNRLERSLALDDEGTHFVEVFVGQLLALWFVGLLSDKSEEGLDFALLVNVHLTL